MQTFYTLIEITAQLKIGYIPLLRLIKAGKLKATKVGGSWRVAENDLRKFIDGPN